MLLQGTTQGGAAPLPPIPKMDKAAPQAASDARQTAQEIRQAAQEIRTAVKDAQAPRIAGQATGPANTTATTAPASSFPGGNNDIPPEVVPMLGIIFGCTTVMVLGFPIIRVLARRFDRSTEKIRASAPDVTPQLRQLQDSVDAMAIEIERISEGQRFTSKLLAERAGEKTAS